MLIENRLLTIAFAFALGVAVAGWERADIASVTILIAVFIFLLRTKGKKELILITAIFCFGIINYYISANDDIEFDIQKEQKSLFLKIITVESFSSEFSSYLARDIHDRLKIKENYLRLRMYHPKTTLLPGDTVLIEEARAYSGSGFNNIGLFNYREYLRDNSIAASIYPSKTGLISVVSSDNSILRELESIKMKMRSRLIFPESPDATAVAYALILADRGLLSNELRNVYTKSGLAHFLVVSGLHIGFIATFGYFLSRILIFIIFCKWKRHILESGTGLIISAIAAIGITILYTALTGFHLPATRAMVMIVVYLATLIVSRSRDFYQAFGAAMIVALLINPSGLFSASFLLSFNVVFFISIFITRYLKSSEVNDLTTDYYIQNRPFSERVRAIFPLTSATIGVSLAAFIAATPLVGYYFNLIPSYAFPLNSTITPLASILLPLGVAATILNSESAIWLFKTSIELLNSIATTVGTLKHGYINIPDFHPVALIFFYLFILIGLDLIDLLKKRVALFLTLLLFVASILTPIGIKYFDNRLIIRFLDVGQGFSAIASWKNGAFIIDGGANYPKFDVGENILAQALFNLGRTNLNAMFGSHGDIDHVGGFLTLYKRVNTEKFYSNTFPTDSETLTNLRNIAILDGKYESLEAGDEILYSDKIKIKVLSPNQYDGSSVNFRHANDNSLVLQFTFDDLKILFTGDIGKKKEKELLKGGVDLKSDILAVAHHGSNTSSIATFIKKVDPKWAIITVGKNNKYRLPSKKVLNRFKRREIKLLRTDLEGEIQLIKDGSSVYWQTFSNKKLTY